MSDPIDDYQPGMRVAAIMSADDETVYLLGYGTYDGKFPTPGRNLTMDDAREVMGVEMSDDEAQKLADAFNMNPRITLDNGKTVWGYECWWGPEDTLRHSFAELGQKVVMVELDRWNEE